MRRRGGLGTGLAIGLVLLAGCGTAAAPSHPPGSARQTVWLGSSAQSVTVMPRFVRGTVWWRLGAEPWRHSAWNHPPASLPTPLRTTLDWMRELHQGQWPGSPVPMTWAAWAGHVGAPLGWVMFPEPANGGPAHPLSILVILPQKSPYHGYGKFFVLWTDTHGQWQATVHGPVAEPADIGSQLGLLWHESTSAAHFARISGEKPVGQPLRH